MAVWYGHGLWRLKHALPHTTFFPFHICVLFSNIASLPHLGPTFPPTPHYTTLLFHGGLLPLLPCLSTVCLFMPPAWSPSCLRSSTFLDHVAPHHLPAFIPHYTLTPPTLLHEHAAAPAAFVPRYPHPGVAPAAPSPAHTFPFLPGYRTYRTLRSPHTLPAFFFIAFHPTFLSTGTITLVHFRGTGSSAFMQYMPALHATLRADAFAGRVPYSSAAIYFARLAGRCPPMVCWWRTARLPVCDALYDAPPAPFLAHLVASRFTTGRLPPALPLPSGSLIAFMVCTYFAAGCLHHCIGSFLRVGRQTSTRCRSCLAK